MHNFLIAATGSFVGIGFLFAFISVIDMFFNNEGGFIEDHYADFLETELTESIDAVWAEVFTLEQEIQALRDDFEEALEAAE